MADRIMNGCTPKATVKEWLIVRLLKKERIIDYLKYMRKLNYYEHQTGLFNQLIAIYYKRKYTTIVLYPSEIMFLWQQTHLWIGVLAQMCY